MTLQEYYDELDRHDWYYAFSDDGRVYDAGECASNRLRHLSKEIEGGEELLVAFTKYHFSGPAWKTPNQPKPIRPCA